MGFNCRIIFYVNTLQLAFYAIVSVYQSQICPVIPIPLYIPAAKNGSNKFSRSCTLRIVCTVCKNLVTFLG